MGPVLRLRGQACLYRGKIDQIPVPVEIGAVADFVFPETALPDPFSPRAICAGVRCGGIGRAREKRAFNIPMRLG